MPVASAFTMTFSALEETHYRPCVALTESLQCMALSCRLTSSFWTPWISPIWAQSSIGYAAPLHKYVIKYIRKNISKHTLHARLRQWKAHVTLQKNCRLLKNCFGRLIKPAPPPYLLSIARQAFLS